MPIIGTLTAREGHTQSSRVLPVLIPFKVLYVVLGFLLLYLWALSFFLLLLHRFFKFTKYWEYHSAVDLVLKKRIVQPTWVCWLFQRRCGNHISRAVLAGITCTSLWWLWEWGHDASPSREHRKCWQVELKAAK